MIEYIANRTVDDKDQAIRFIGVSKFIVLKDEQRVVLPDDFEEDPKELYGDEFDRVAEYRTFYDTQEKQFRLVECHQDKSQPDHYIPIPENGGEIDGWMVGRLDVRSQ